MSNYNIKAREKKTGKIVQVACVDNYFRNHIYGYFIDNDVFHLDTKKEVLTEEEFNQRFEEVQNET